jgi:hypothetical protein
MAFVLNEKGELFADIETAYGTTPAASTLTVADVQNLRTFQTRRVPGKIPVEDEGGGMIPGVQGQELLKVNEMVEYSGSMWLREFTVPNVDGGERPEIDKWLRAGGFLPGVHAGAGPSSITYDMALANNQESMVYRYREWDDKGGRKLHDVQGGRHSTVIRWTAGQGLLLEINDGMALTYATSQVAPADTPPSLQLNGGTSVIPFLNSTNALIEIGGASYTGKIREVVIGLPQRTEMLPDSGSPTGFCEAFNNITLPTLEILVYEKDDGLQIRDAWATANAHFDLSITVPGPTAAANTFAVRVYFDIQDVAEEAGPGQTKGLRITGKLLFADRAAHTAVALDPSEVPVRMVYTSP